MSLIERFDRATSVSNSVFHMTEFRPGQLDAITAVLSRRDVIVRLATGAGKSLCYLIPTLTTGDTAVCIVISPLSALMHDQVCHTTLRVPTVLMVCFYLRGG